MACNYILFASKIATTYYLVEGTKEPNYISFKESTFSRRASWLWSYRLYSHAVQYTLVFIEIFSYTFATRNLTHLYSVRQANCVVRELGVAVEYQVTLQVPLANLYASASTGQSARPAVALSPASGSPIPCEPAILVLVHNRPKRSSPAPGSCADLSKQTSTSTTADGEPVVQREQLWSVDKFENRLTEMLELYQQCRDLSRYTSAPLASRRHLENFDDLEASEHSTPTRTSVAQAEARRQEQRSALKDELSPSSRAIREATPESNRSSRSINELLARGEPFYDSQEQHILIGVANIVLQSLFYNFEFDYEAPIISQQGEVFIWNKILCTHWHLGTWYTTVLYCMFFEWLSTKQIAGKLRIQLSRVVPNRPTTSSANNTTSSSTAGPPIHQNRPLREQILDSTDEEEASSEDSDDSCDYERRVRAHVRIRDCRRRLGYFTQYCIF